MLWWGRVVSRFIGVNVLVQAVGLLVGILVIRGLDKTEYGYYAVFTSMIAAFVLVSDSGVAGTLLAALGREANDRTRAAELIRTTLSIQRRVSLLVAAACSVAMSFVLLQLDAPAISVISAMAAFLVSATLLAHKSVFQAYRRATADYRSLQTVVAASAGFRLLAVTVLSLLRSISLPLMLLVNMASYLIEFLVLRQRDGRLFSARGTIDQQFKSNQWLTVRRTLPMSLAIVAQTQLLTLSLGVFGNADVLAEVSALSRFAAVLAIVGAAVSDIGTGLVARAGNLKRAILLRYSASIGLLLAASVVALLVLALFGDQLIKLLGSGYEGLETPLLIIGAGTVGIMTADAMRVLNQARGWTRYSWIFVPAIGMWFLSGVLWFDLTDVLQASIWMALQALTGLLTQSVVLIAGLRSISTIGG